MINLHRLTCTFRVTKKAKIYKKPLYEAIPDFHKPHYIDIHDGYTKRTMQEVRAELRKLNIQVQVTRHIYNDHDPHSIIKNRKAIIEFDPKCLKLTHLQEERFKILMGSRLTAYNSNKNDSASSQANNKVRMTCEMYPEYTQNFQKLVQQFEEVILQSKRAP